MLRKIKASTVVIVILVLVIAAYAASKNSASANRQAGVGEVLSDQSINAPLPGSDGGQDGQRSGDGRPDLAAAAELLGITEEELKNALGEPGQGPPDLEAAAELLGITVEELAEALGIPADGQPPEDGGQQPEG